MDFTLANAHIEYDCASHLVQGLSYWWEKETEQHEKWKLGKTNLKQYNVFGKSVINFCKHQSILDKVVCRN